MGIVNIFLGGSGKYIAEELKGTSLYYDVRLPDFVAFDLDTSTFHGGTFALDMGSELLTVDGAFPRFAQGQVASEWATLDAGDGLTPLPNAAGPKLRPESSVMRRIGINVGTLPAPTNGLWGVRGPGLLAFASFLDPRGPGLAASHRRSFELRLRNALQQAQAAGGPVWINLVASTAGGTGAGTFLPITLWLRWYATRVVGLPDVKVALVLFWWTTFQNEQTSGRERTELLSKGQSGSYAVLRELELLDFGSRLPEPTRFPDRIFPVGRGAGGETPLLYQLNGKPFDRVFWMGMRPDDTTATKVDVYEEGSRLLQVLSNPAASALITAATGQFAQRQVLSITSVDYPRLRVAQRLSGELVESALELLIGDPATDPVAADALRDLGGPQPNPLETFIRAEENNALSREKAGNAPASVENLDTLIRSLVADTPLTLAVRRNDQRVQAGRAAAESAWNEYCVGLKRDLDQQRSERGQLRRRAAERLTSDTIDRFRSWLSSEVVAPKLAPADDARPAHSLATLDKTLAAIAQDLLSVNAFFSARGGISDRVPLDPEAWRFRPVQEIEARIQDQHELLLTPPAGNTGGLSMWRWLMVGVVLLCVAAVVWYIIEPLFADMGRVLVATGAGIAMAVLAWWLLRQKQTVEQRREEQEDILFNLYEALVYREAADILFEKVKATLIPACNEELRRISEQSEKLRTVYRELGGLARSRRVRATKSPKHSVDQVGFNLTLPPHQRDPWITSLASTLRVTPQLGTDRVDFNLMIRGVAPVREYATPVAPLADYVREQGRGSLGELPGQREFMQVDKTLDDLGTTILREVLPQSFQAAMQADGFQTPQALTQRMQDLLRKLMHRDNAGRTRPEPDPRRPSVALTTINPAYQLLLVPDAEVAGLVNQALGGLDPATTAELRDYMPVQSLTPVPEIGPSVVTVTIWQANQLTELGGAYEARDAYYRTAPNGTDPYFYSQDSWNFQMLPELAAAAAIEFADPVREPLHPLVASRLLGSDPDSGGPTVIELFYLLRHRDLLRFELDGEGADMRRVFRLRLPDADAITLYSEQAVAPRVGNDPFGGGDGRSVVNGFDAFCDFLLYDGAVVGAQVIQQPHPRFSGLPYGAGLHVTEWTRLGPARLGQLQRSIVELWYQPGSQRGVTDDRDGMIYLAQDDANSMPVGVATDWARAVRHIAQTGAEKRVRLFA